MKAFEALLLKSFNFVDLDNEEYKQYGLTGEEQDIVKIKAIFEYEKGYMLAHKGYVFALQDWLQGLTSFVNVPTFDHEILDFGYDSCLLKRDSKAGVHEIEMAENELIESYWFKLASALYDLIGRIEG